MKTKKITLQNFNIFVSKTQSLRVGVGYIYEWVLVTYIVMLMMATFDS